ncbi:hypothetical protein YB2330_002302 [Saitoella coloradoensis]
MASYAQNDFEADVDVDGAVDLVVGALESTDYSEDQLAQSYYTQQLQQQQQQELASIAPEVRSLIVYLHQAILNQNTDAIQGCISHFYRLTEKHQFPEAEIVAPLVNDDQNFLTIYRELYFRNIYAKGQPTLEQRFRSYDNYCDLFNFILNSDGPVNLDLPNQYCDSIVDEFVWQFSSFAQYRARLSKKSEEDITILRENPQIWSCYSVLNVLYSLIQKSRINEQLAAIKEGENPNDVAGEYGVLPLYRQLGYCSLIGLLRVHTLLGDFTLALKMLDNVDIKKSPFARVPNCHFQTYYYQGFAYMMLHRYADAIESFIHILVFISRTKQYHNRSAQYEQVNKKADQVHALLAICVALCPTRLDENTHSALREKFGEQLARMSRGGPEALPIFEELFTFAAPKFINPVPPTDPENVAEPLQHHQKIFMEGVKGQMWAATLRSYMKLYTTMKLEKLAAFLEIDEEELRSQLLVYKQNSRQFRRTEGALLSGEVVSTSELDFSLEGDIIHIAEAKTGRRYGDWFMRNATKYLQINEGLAKKH